MSKSYYAELQKKLSDAGVTNDEFNLLDLYGATESEKRITVELVISNHNRIIEKLQREIMPCCEKCQLSS